MVKGQSPNHGHSPILRSRYGEAEPRLKSGGKAVTRTELATKTRSYWFVTQRQRVATKPRCEILRILLLERQEGGTSGGVIEFVLVGVAWKLNGTGISHANLDPVVTSRR
jgi:hypothetical protein